MTGAAPGWYHAEGDPPDTERFWDGSQWTEGPRPIGGAEPTPSDADPSPSGSEPVPGTPTSMPPIDTGFTPPMGGSPPLVGGSPGLGSPGIGGPGLPPTGLPIPSMGSPLPAGGFYPEQSKSTTALVLSIVGFFCCGFPAIGGIWYARQEQKAIEAGRRDPSKQGMATAALIIGIIVLVLYLLVYGIWILALVFSSSTTFN